MNNISQHTLANKHKAIRLISTKNLSYQNWLEVSKKGIGSSDAATAIGLNPYKSPIALWAEKTGKVNDFIQLNYDNETSPMYWGKLLEPLVAETYSKKIGFKVRRINAVLQHPDEDKSWMLANLDYTVVGQDEVQILECKTAGEHGAKLWKDGVPEYYQLQVQHQLAVTGKQAADVCVLICGQELKIYRIQRDNELIDKLILLEKRFWDYVQRDIEPPVDGSNSTLRLYPKDTDSTINFTDDTELSAVFEELKSLKTMLDEGKQREVLLKQKIQQAMGSHSKAIFGTGEITWRKSKDSITLDVKKLVDEKPELIEQYPLFKEGSRRFLIV